MEWLKSDTIKKRYGFKVPVAILSKLVARVDLYLLTYQLLERLRGNGHSIYDRTTIYNLKVSVDNVVLKTTQGCTLHCKHAVFTNNFTSQKLLKKKVAQNQSRYGFIIAPIEPELLGEINKTLLREFARPYLYMRIT